MSAIPGHIVAKPNNIDLDSDNIVLEPDALTLDPDNIVLEPDAITLEPNNIALEPDNIDLEPDALTLERNSIYNDILQTNILNEPNLFVATVSYNICPFDFSVSLITQAFKDDFLAKEEFLKNAKKGTESSSNKFEIIAINTNYNHFCRKGCEYDIQIKSKKKIIPKKRQPQGDESVFHSAIQLTVILNISLCDYIHMEDKSKVKKYFVKLYSTGKLQIPGIIEQDLSDGILIINGIIDYINTLNISTAAFSNISYDHIDIIMMNYNTELCITSPRILFNFSLFGEYISQLENKKLYEGAYLIWDSLVTERPLDYFIEKFKNTVFSKYNHLILPPFIIHNTKLINNNKYISFLFKDVSDGATSKKIATVKIFQKGKINILGAKNAKHVRLIYNFIIDIIRHNIEQMISIKALSVKGA